LGEHPNPIDIFDRTTTSCLPGFKFTKHIREFGLCISPTVYAIIRSCFIKVADNVGTMRVMKNINLENVLYEIVNEGSRNMHF
jgi:hypothetical protein